MPESGFAPAAGSVAREEAAEAPPVEQPRVSEETLEDTLSRVTDLLTEQVNENFGGNLVEKFLQPDARANIVRTELIKLLTSEMTTLEGTECPEALTEHVNARITNMLSNSAIHDALHETHNRAIREAVAAQLSTQLDPSIDAFDGKRRFCRDPDRVEHNTSDADCARSCDK